MSWWLSLSRETFQQEIATRYAVNRAEESRRSFRTTAEQLDQARRGGQQRARHLGVTVKPQKGPHSAAKTACKHGHPFDAANTRIRKKDGARICRACMAMVRQRHRERQGADDRASAAL